MALIDKVQQLEHLAHLSHQLTEEMMADLPADHKAVQYMLDAILKIFAAQIAIKTITEKP
jgi:hypothetical protein